MPGGDPAQPHLARGPVFDVALGVRTQSIIDSHGLVLSSVRFSLPLIRSRITGAETIVKGMT
jgi:hypothetical protein